MLDLCSSLCSLWSFNPKYTIVDCPETWPLDGKAFSAQGGAGEPFASEAGSAVAVLGNLYFCL